MAEDSCSHLIAITAVKHPARRECEECVKLGASWVICELVKRAVSPFVVMTPQTATRPSTLTRVDTP